MRSEVFCELEYFGSLNFLNFFPRVTHLVNVFLILLKDCLEVVEAEANTFGDSLSCITREKDIFLNE